MADAVSMTEAMDEVRRGQASAGADTNPAAADVVARAELVMREAEECAQDERTCVDLQARMMHHQRESARLSREIAEAPPVRFVEGSEGDAFAAYVLELAQADDPPPPAVVRDLDAEYWAVRRAMEPKESGR